MEQLTLFSDLSLPLKCSADEAQDKLKKLKELGLIIGTDEAGRGSLAGPVVAAAVYLTQEQEEILLSMKLRDSKLLSHNAREKIFAKIQGLGVLWRVAQGSRKLIDEKNILQASLLTMSKAVNKLAEKLNNTPCCVVVDGNKNIPEIKFNQWTLIQADKLIPVVSAASIVAKVLRDRLMINISKKYPDYNLEKNKGYPTAFHINAVKEKGMSDIHRKTFCVKFLERK
ncbi:MAG: ribonuclease HII [Synergistaceae bacterium]|nr:ribonuclease HII [Synergistaceae bacterium]